MQKVINVIKNTGSKLLFYATKQTLAYLKEVYSSSIVNAEYKVFKDWDDFLVLSRELKNDDNLIVVMSRKNHLSYHSKMAKMPTYLNRYFQKNSFILVYPVQIGIEDDGIENSTVSTVKKTLLRFDGIGKLLEKIYKKNKPDSSGEQ